MNVQPKKPDSLVPFGETKRKLIKSIKKFSNDISKAIHRLMRSNLWQIKKYLEQEIGGSNIFI